MLAMPSLTIRHVTTYRYRQPVAFGEHRMMLRPRDSHDQKVIEASLDISPEPSSLRFTEDAFGNHVAIARFDGSATELSFESIVSLEHSPADTADLDLAEVAGDFPVDYSALEMADLAHCIQRRHPDPDDEVGRWPASSCTPAGRSARWSSLSVSPRASIRAFSIGGAKQRESSSRSRRCGSATAVAATSPC